jgi:hypothetical protein
VHNLTSQFHRIKHHPDHDHGTDRVQLECERSYDTEIPTPSAHAPEQIGVLSLARSNEATVSRDDVNREQVVASQPVLAREPAKTATECQPRNTCLRDHSARGCQTEYLGFVVEVTQGAARLDTGNTRLGIHLHTAHHRKVDDQPPIAQGISRDIMTPATNCQYELVSAGEIDGGDDICWPRAASDQTRPLVNHAIPYRASGIVARVSRTQERAAYMCLELCHRRFIQ